jgi:DNA polymerase III sliding clamp (beta) subunit (PCNA family)
MEFNINVTKLLNSLGPVADISTKNTVKDFEGSFMTSINVRDNELELVAHGGNACIISKLLNSKIDKLGYECVKEGSAVVETKKLFTTLSSFRPNKEISVTMKKGELEIICDKTEEQSLPTSKNRVASPMLSDSISVEIDVNREIFISGMQKVHFSVGIEEFRPQYLCQVFDISKTGARFIGGNGARFAINEITGKGISTTDKKQRVIFPKNNIPNIISILKTSSSEKISLKEGKATKINSDQIIIEFDEITIILLGIDTNLKTQYADVDKILGFNHPYQFKVDLDDWKYPTKGTRATYSEEMKSASLVHNAEIEVDTKKDKFIVKTDTNMKSKRTVPVTVIQSGDDEKVTLRCNSLYLAEMINQGYDSGTMIMRFIDEDKPIVVDYPDLVDGVRDTVEKYSMFFTTSRKKK